MCGYRVSSRLNRAGCAWRRHEHSDGRMFLVSWTPTEVQGQRTSACKLAMLVTLSLMTLLWPLAIPGGNSVAQATSDER